MIKLNLRSARDGKMFKFTSAFVLFQLLFATAQGADENSLADVRSDVEALQVDLNKDLGRMSGQEMKRYPYFDVKSEMGSIRKLLVNLRQETKSEIEEIRQVVMQQQCCVRSQHKCPCGFDYLPEAGSCFKFIFEAMTWSNAADRCKGILPGVHLAAITSQEENAAIIRYLQSQFNKHRIGTSGLPYASVWSHAVWISGQRRNPEKCDNPFVWKTLYGIEMPFKYTNWAAGQPNCHNENEQCAQITPGLSHAWNDNSCKSLSYPLCEI